MSRLVVADTRCRKNGCSGEREGRKMCCAQHSKVCCAEGCERPRSGKHLYCGKHREDYPGYPAKRRAHLKHRYGITVEQYEQMFNDQNGVCVLCLEEAPILVVDHDHTTGRVRGLLCRKCNAALGMVDADDKWLDRTRSYVKW